MTTASWISALALLSAPLVAGMAWPDVVPGGASSPPPATEVGWAQNVQEVVVQTDPEGGVIALTLRFGVGSSADPDGREGTAALLGRTVERTLNDRLRDRESQASVQVREDAILVTLTTPPDSWHFPLEETRDVLLNRPLSPGEVDGVRQLQQQRLIFEEGAPVRTFQVERMNLIRGPSAPVARPVSGSTDSLDRITVDDLDAFRANHLRSAPSVLAIVGPVGRDEVARRLSVEPSEATATSPFREAPSPVQGNREAVGDTVEPPPDDPPPALRTRLARELGPPLAVAASGAMAWTSGDRQLRNMELTSTWMAVAWPFPEGTPATLLDFLGHTLQEALVPSPPDPGLYGAEVDLFQIEGRPVIVASVTVDPRVALRWEDRTLERMASLADSPPEGSFFELTRRRYRNRLLLRLADPAERSQHLAEEIAGTGATRDLQAEIWRLTREGLSDLAASAGPPRLFLLGPVEMMEGAPR